MADVVTHRKIAAELREEILRGDYKPGHQLPSITTLMAKHGVSRQTVSQAYDMLKREGLVEARRGAGAFVKHRPTVRRLTRNRLSGAARRAGRGWFLSDADVSGFTPTVVVELRREAADQRSAAALDIDEGAEVVVRDRVMSADDVPVQLAVSRYPADIAAGSRLEDENPGRGGSWAVLEELGFAVEQAVEFVRTRPPSVTEVDLLRLAEGTPVLQVTRVAYDGGGRPVEVNDMVLAGDRYELAYEISVD
jgi:GntR family transcriptional regulator